MKTTLITGGAGFLGSHLCHKLINNGHNVCCVDNLLTGSIDNIQDLLPSKSFRFVEGGVAEALDLDFIHLDEIYHLASPAAPVDIQSHGLETRRVNTSGTKALLDLAEDYNSRFLFVSTVKVHGECARVDDYIKGKRQGEAICADYPTAKVARLANCYGPKMALDDSRVIPTFITRLLLNRPISLWNGGGQTDSFCYVDDIIDGLIRFMASPHSGLIEFGAAEGTTIASLANLIAELIGVQPVTTIDVVPVSDECHKVANLERAIDLLQWAPTISLIDGLAKTIKDFELRMEALHWKKSSF